MEEQSKLIKLLDIQKKGFSNFRSIILAIRNHQLKLTDAVVEFGLLLIKNYKQKLGDEQELFYAAIDCKIYGLGTKVWKEIKSKFPDQDKTQRLHVALLQSTNNNDQADVLLQEQIDKNLVDIESRKMQIAIKRKEQNYTEFIEDMNQYLEENPNDGEAWLELGDLYLEFLNYNKALYCYEELLLLFPKKYIYMVIIAEIFYTLGSIQNLQNAKNYYCYVLSKDPQCFRALWGLIQTCKRIRQQHKGDEKTKELQELSIQALKAFYEKRGSINLIDNFPFNKYIEGKWE